MSYVRYPYLLSDQAGEMNEEMDLSTSKIYPQDVVPFVVANLERIEYLLSAFRLAVLPGAKFEDTYSIFLPGLSGSTSLFASDYCLIHAYFRTYLHNLGQGDRQMTLIADRSFDTWQEVSLMTIGIGRIEGCEYISKILLIEPTGIFANLDLKPSSHWYSKLYRFSQLEFDAAISPDHRINTFGGNLNFDLQIYLNGQYVILKALKLTIVTYPRLKDFKLRAEDLIRQMKVHPEQNYPAKQIFEEYTIGFKALKSQTLEITTGMIREMQDRADTYGDKYQYVVNDCIVLNRIMGELTSRLNDCEKSIDQLTLSSLTHTKLQMFIQWHKFQISVYQSLESKFSLSNAPIDRYSILEQVDECDVLLGYLDLVKRKLEEFEDTLNYYPEYRKQAKDIEDTSAKIRPIYENLQRKIIDFANDNENSDPLLVDKFIKYFSSRNRKTQVEYEGTKFFKETLKSCHEIKRQKEFDPKKNPENEKLNANHSEAEDAKFDLVEFRDTPVDLNAELQTNAKDSAFYGYDDSKLDCKKKIEHKEVDIKADKDLFSFDDCTNNNNNAEVPVFNNQKGKIINEMMGEKFEKMSLPNDDLIIRFD